MGCKGSQVRILSPRPITYVMQLEPRWFQSEMTQSSSLCLPHDTAGPALRRRSRSAAKPRTAWMCSRRSSEKSARIARSSIPLARYSSRSETVKRVPLMQGLPLRTPGEIEVFVLHAAEIAVKKHPHYRLAKAGDILAADALVADMANTDCVAPLQALLGGRQ